MQFLIVCLLALGASVHADGNNAAAASAASGGGNNAAAASAASGGYIECGVNEVFLDCGCDQGCEPRACAQYCPRPGCYCIPGYVRYLGICIKRSACPNQCGENERLGCGLCDQVCNEEPRGCAAGCERDSCYCREGYVRETNQPGSRCIRESECPALVDYGGSSDQAADSAVAYYSGDYVQCNVNEEYRDCGCDKDCDGPRACAQSCPRPGCYCIPGYVRDLGICIPPSACPRNQNAGPALVDYGGPSNQAADSAVAYYDDYNQCQVNEEFLDCGCDQGCEPRACAQSCPRPGCYCIPGYVRYLGICIPRSTCPGNQNDGPDYGDYDQCGVNEVFLDCGCDQGCKPRACAQSCPRPGCYCIPGYVRDLGICIPRSTCPGNQDAGPALGNNGGFRNQGAAPPPRLQSSSDNRANNRRAVPPSSLQSGFRNQGGAPPPQLQSSSNNGGAAPASSLQSSRAQCPVNEYYNDCGDCDQVCNLPPRACSQGCNRPGCYCNKGYVRANRNSGSRCIPKSNCFQCRQNEVYQQCGVGSQCEDYCGRGPNACAYCQPGCYCQNGYIRQAPGNTTMCIPKGQC